MPFSASGEKKVAEHGAALFGEEAGGYFDFVIQLGMVHDGEDAAAGSGLGVGGGVDEATDAGVEDGSGAHGTGFEGDVEGAVVEAVVAEVKASLAEGYDLGMGGGVVVAEDPVLAAGDDLVVVDDDCTHGNFAFHLGGAGFGDGGAEVVFVGGEHGVQCSSLG